MLELLMLINTISCGLEGKCNEVSESSDKESENKKCAFAHRRHTFCRWYFCFARIFRHRHPLLLSPCDKAQLSRLWQHPRGTLSAAVGLCGGIQIQYDVSARVSVPSLGIFTCILQIHQRRQILLQASLCSLGYHLGDTDYSVGSSAEYLRHLTC